MLVTLGPGIIIALSVGAAWLVWLVLRRWWRDHVDMPVSKLPQSPYRTAPLELPSAPRKPIRSDTPTLSLDEFTHDKVESDLRMINDMMLQLKRIQMQNENIEKLCVDNMQRLERAELQRDFERHEARADRRKR